MTEKAEGAYETKIPYLVNFIESVKTNTDPVVPVEIGHRSCTVCTLGNIAYDLGRPLKWNPEAETNRLFNKAYSEGYRINSIA